jgi:hypothetical protein
MLILCASGIGAKDGEVVTGAVSDVSLRLLPARNACFGASITCIGIWDDVYLASANFSFAGFEMNPDLGKPCLLS